jgi:hypothetical protein
MVLVDSSSLLTVAFLLHRVRVSLVIRAKQLVANEG